MKATRDFPDAAALDSQPSWGLKVLGDIVRQTGARLKAMKVEKHLILLNLKIWICLVFGTSLLSGCTKTKVKYVPVPVSQPQQLQVVQEANPNWRFIGSTYEGNVLIDSNSVQQTSSDNAELVFSVTNEPAMETLRHVVVDCSMGNISIYEQAIYSGTGTLVSSDKFPDPGLSYPTTPGSAGELVLSAMCSG